VIAERRLLVLQMNSPLPSIVSHTVMVMAPMKKQMERAVLQAGRTKRVLLLELEPLKLEKSSAWEMSKFARKK
tara:strand:+ start:6862 stop:7080 length:219 start_codon:yes stop_codon:yes gene_type:complete